MVWRLIIVLMLVTMAIASPVLGATSEVRHHPVLAWCGAPFKPVWHGACKVGRGIDKGARWMSKKVEPYNGLMGFCAGAGSMASSALLGFRNFK